MDKYDELKRLLFIALVFACEDRALVKLFYTKYENY
jgi:hypothetical protein